MSATTKNTKENKQLAVSLAILEVIEKEGLLGVTHSKVSRKSKVSRAWIYEYIGKEKNALIEYGADVFAGHIARVKLKDLPTSQEELALQLKEATQFLFDETELNPIIVKLYFKFRGTSNEVGKVIQKYERDWLQGAVKTLTAVQCLPVDQATLLAELVLTLRLGFAHRIATSSSSKKARENAERTLDLIYMILQGTE